MSESYFVSPYGPETCSNCGGHKLSYQLDIVKVHERWSPIHCDRCGARTYEVWRGDTLIKIVGVIKPVVRTVQDKEPEEDWDMEW